MPGSPRGDPFGLGPPPAGPDLGFWLVLAVILALTLAALWGALT